MRRRDSEAPIAEHNSARLWRCIEREKRCCTYVCAPCTTTTATIRTCPQRYTLSNMYALQRHMSSSGARLRPAARQLARLAHWHRPADARALRILADGSWVRRSGDAIVHRAGLNSAPKFVICRRLNSILGRRRRRRRQLSLLRNGEEVVAAGRIAHLAVRYIHAVARALPIVRKQRVQHCCRGAHKPHRLSGQHKTETKAQSRGEGCRRQRTDFCSHRLCFLFFFRIAFLLLSFLFFFRGRNYSISDFCGLLAHTFACAKRRRRKVGGRSI